MILLFSFCMLVSEAQQKQKEEKLITDTTTAKDIKESVRLSEVTLAATRFSQNKKLLAQQVYVISRNHIENSNQPTTAELLSQSGEVLVQKSQLGGGSPVIRGFEANKVLICVDGIRMNNAIYRGGHLQSVITLNDESMEKAELLFGPSSVMYGSDALGGVMSFYTRDPEITKKKTVKAGASGRYISACEGIHLHADVSASFPKWGSFTGFSFSQFGDLRQGKKGYSAFPGWGYDSLNTATINGIDTLLQNTNPLIQTPTGYSQYDAIQKFLFYTGTWKHVINLQLSTSTQVPRYDRLTEVSNGIPKSSAWYYGPQFRLLAAWQTEIGKTRWFDQARISPAFQKILESRHNRNFGSSSLKNRNEEVKVISVNADFSKKINRSEWTYGAEISINHVNSKAYTEDLITGETAPLDTRYPDGGSQTRQLALYGSVLYNLHEHWILNAGIRANASQLQSTFNDTGFFPFPFREIKQNNRAITGNAGIVWLPGNDWKCSLLFATGFRTPNVDDLAKVFESTSGNLIVPNPRLKPEKTINYEAGIMKNWSGRWQLNISGWYTRYRDILTTDSGTFNGQSVIVYDGTLSQVKTTTNKNKAWLWGWNVNADGQIGKWLFIHSAVHYTYGRINEVNGDYPLDHIPPIYGKLSLEGRWSRITGEIFTLFNGRKDSSDYNLRGEDNQLYSADPQRGFTPAWNTLNGKLTLNINKLYNVQLACENVLDRFYRVFSSGLSGPGRNFIITVRAKLP
jgi:hemoglobin/transferrin/lactoferrin receptor protein